MIYEVKVFHNDIFLFTLSVNCKKLITTSCSLLQHAIGPTALNCIKAHSPHIICPFYLNTTEPSSNGHPRTGQKLSLCTGVSRNDLNYTPYSN